MINVLKRADVAKKYKSTFNSVEQGQQTKKSKISYTVIFLNKDFALGTRRTLSYKVALREAERWVLSGEGYVSRIEWEAITGTKFVELDYYTVQQQRKARVAYRHVVKTNQFQNPYVTI